MLGLSAKRVVEIGFDGRLIDDVAGDACRIPICIVGIRNCIETVSVTVGSWSLSGGGR